MFAVGPRMTADGGKAPPQELSGPDAWMNCARYRLTCSATLDIIRRDWSRRSRHPLVVLLRLLPSISTWIQATAGSWPAAPLGAGTRFRDRSPTFSYRPKFS